MGKVEFTQFQNWIRQVDFNARGIQTGPFAAHSAHFVLKFFHHFSQKGIHQTPKVDETEGFSVPGAFKLDHLQPIEPFLFQKIFNFFTFILAELGKTAIQPVPTQTADLSISRSRLISSLCTTSR